MDRLFQKWKVYMYLSAHIFLESWLDELLLWGFLCFNVFFQPFDLSKKKKKKKKALDFEELEADNDSKAAAPEAVEKPKEKEEEADAPAAGSVF